ncbi:MAG: hypothetical protein ABFS23_12845, partial [Pseudomonadota bacterium]
TFTLLAAVMLSQGALGQPSGIDPKAEALLEKATTIGGVEHHQCAGVYYRAAFQGNNLVYVASQP